MDGTQEPEASLRAVAALCTIALDGLALPKSQAGRIDMLRRLDELTAALATVTTRCNVAAVLNRTPLAKYGAARWGSTPMAREAGERLLVAVSNVIALRDT
ncbi:hypothetical protein [Arthrobacter sp. C9C5]|uniref:hypothetical protein n=1 Tax=Arthrobacter sp. C9C5 TaxID=2735267 RepID=UPI001584BA3D|nr:hypothetical protein [Arthrobacter sp. C9C5]NUU31947.1 hypothetical protein [Arthrobacter sp. C9C5]